MNELEIRTEIQMPHPWTHSQRRRNKSFVSTAGSESRKMR